jgi:hypothetical protein
MIIDTTDELMSIPEEWSKDGITDKESEALLDNIIFDDMAIPDEWVKDDITDEESKALL